MSVAQFLAQHRTRGHQQPSPRTIATLRKSLNRYSTWLNGREPSLDDHQQFILSLLPQYSSGYVRSLDQAVRAYHNHLGIPAAKVAIGRERRRITFLTEAQVEQIIQACTTPLERAAITLLFESALRASELVGIRWDDIDWEAGFVRVTRKGGDQGDVPIFPRSMAALRAIQAQALPRTFVFPLDYDALYHLCRVVGQKAGIPLHPHALRHARASQLRRRGFSLDRIQELLGHTNPMTTSYYYAHLSPVDLRREMMEGLGG